MPGRDAAWYVSRLRAMRPAEVVHHARTGATLRSWSRRPPAVVPPRLPAHAPAPFVAASVATPDDVRRLVTAADRMLRGEYVFLSVEDPHGVEQWHRDPETGVVCPRIASRRIDFSDPVLVGNVKNVWEKNRHQHLTLLASAFAATGDARFADEVAQQLSSWIAANPFLAGVNWASGIEVGLRLVSWAWIERLLRGSAAHEDLFGAEGVAWAPVQHSVMLLEATPSVGSSANNHTIAELLGVLVACSAWPYWPGWPEKARRAAAALERHARDYLAPSGLSREMAFGYHVFATEMYLTALAEQALGTPLFSEWFVGRVCDAVAAAREMGDAGGSAMGDADDSCVLVLDDAGEGRLAVAEGLLRGLTDDRPRANDPLAARLLAANRTAAVGCGTSSRAPRPPISDVGLHVLRSDGPVPAVCLFDAGPLGYLSLAAHGHADALSFCLTLDGEPFVIDPGTYKFGDAPGWRRYFRGTRAHNTVLVDGEDQSLQAGPFMWTDHADGCLVDRADRESGGRAVARHDGYRRLSHPLRHVRAVELDAGSLLVSDDLETDGPHDVEWRLHLHPALSVGLDAALLVAAGERSRLTAVLDPSLEWELVRGGEDAGWWSPAFNVKLPSATVVGRGRIPGDASLECRFSWEGLR